MNNNTLLYVGIAVLVGGAALAMSGKKDDIPYGPQNDQNPQPTLPSGNTPKPAPTPRPIKPLDLDKVLKKGDKGGEVAKLQSLLGFVKPDGDFGNLTLAALIKQKNVQQISVNGFSKVPTINRNLLPKGTKVMANNPEGTKTFVGEKKADGTYFAKMDIFSGSKTYDYGTPIGTVRTVSADNLWYSIDVKGIFVDEVRFVKTTDVKQY